MVVIETDRLILRPLTADDYDDYLALANEPEVARFTLPLSPAEASERLCDTEREWAERGYGRMAILDRNDRRFLGRSGLHLWSQFDETEIGWSLKPSEWGRGYASEAARACLEWGFAKLTLPYITAMIQPDNERSLAVARGLGFEPLREDVFFDLHVIVHALTRPEHRAPGA